MTILGLTETFKTMNEFIRAWPGTAEPERSLTAYSSESIWDKDIKFWLNLHPSLKFYSMDTMHFSQT